MIFFKLAWRNNWRHRWRSVLTVTAVVFGLSLTIWGFCLTEGSHEQIIRNSVESFTGHLQVHRRGFHDDPGLRKVFAPDSEFAAVLDSGIPGLDDWGLRISTFALASVGETSFAAMMVGIEPERERRFIHWDEKIEAGTYLQPGDIEGALVGADLAENLRIGIGDTVIIVTQDYYGSLSGALRVVRGTIRSHAPQLDRAGLLVSLESAREMLDMQGKANTAVVMATSSEEVEPLIAELQSRLAGQELEVIGWREILPDLVQLVELDNIFGILTNLILLLVIGFMVLNTFLMSVMERIREFGIMRSLGASPGRVVGLILFEAALLVGLGFVLANAVGIGASVYNSIHPLDFSGMGDEIYKHYGMDPRIYARVTWYTLIYPNLFVAAVILLALVYPAWRAARIGPAEAVSRGR
ncbi:MAG: ABC transporter permease [Candidatus Glassbacteria bacterium]|nr:ABC transporter permease [Candidatus Glassbacteria bacterium]